MALGGVSGLMVSRLLMPRGRGELAILLYFPTLMAAFFSLGTPQAITALISKDPKHPEEILTTGFRLAVAQVLLAVPLFILCAPLTLTGDNRQLAIPVQISCACGAFMILVPYFNAMAYGLKRFTWVNAVTLAGQASYVVALLILWLIGTLTPLTAVLSALGSQLLQCLLHLIHIKPSWLNRRLPRGAYRRCLGLGIRFAAPSLAAVVLLNADRAILIRTTTLEQIGYFAIAFAVTMPITITTEAFTQIGFVEVSSAENADASLALMLRRFQMAQVVAGASFLFACALVGPVIRFGFGKAYLSAIPAAYPLGAGNVAQSHDEDLGEQSARPSLHRSGHGRSRNQPHGADSSQHRPRAAMGSVRLLLRRPGCRGDLPDLFGALSHDAARCPPSIAVGISAQHCSRHGARIG